MFVYSAYNMTDRFGGRGLKFKCHSHRFLIMGVTNNRLNPILSLTWQPFMTGGTSCELY